MPQVAEEHDHPEPNGRSLDSDGNKLLRFVVAVSLFCISCLIGGTLWASLNTTFLASFAGTRSSVKNLTISLVPWNMGLVIRICLR